MAKTSEIKGHYHTHGSIPHSHSSPAVHIEWGQADLAVGGAVTIVFDTPFINTPVVVGTMVIASSSSAQAYICYISTVSNTAVTFQGRLVIDIGATTDVGDRDAGIINWIAREI